MDWLEAAIRRHAYRWRTYHAPRLRRAIAQEQREVEAFERARLEGELHEYELHPGRCGTRRWAELVARREALLREQLARRQEAAGR